jgi:hypothetical protein
LAASHWDRTRLSKITGIGLNEKPELTDAKNLSALVSSIIKQENGRNPYNQAAIDQAVQKVLVEVHVKGNTNGVSATAKSDGANVSTATPRISPVMAGPY